MLKDLFWHPRRLELRDLSRADQETLLQEVVRRDAGRSSSTMATLFFMVQCVLSVGLAAVTDSFLQWALLFVPTMPFSIAAFLYVAKIKSRRTLEQVMLERNLRPAVCFRCGYDLRGTPGDACPECGCAIAPLDRDEAC